MSYNLKNWRAKAINGRAVWARWAWRTKGAVWARKTKELD